jgi:hypothetical protein
MVGESNYFNTKRTERKNFKSATIKTMVAAKVANSTTASTTVVKGDSSKLTSPVSTIKEAEISQTTTKCRWKEVTIEQNTTTMSQEQIDEPTRLLWKMNHNERVGLNMYGESGITTSSVTASSTTAEATVAVAVDFQEVDLEGKSSSENNELRNDATVRKSNRIKKLSTVKKRHFYGKG